MSIPGITSGLQFALFFMLGCLSQAVGAKPIIHHGLKVSVVPDQQRIVVEDRISLPPEYRRSELSFTLHAGLSVNTGKAKSVLKPVHTATGAVPISRYRLALPAGQHNLTLEYEGQIFHPLEKLSEGVGPGRQVTAGWIGPQGVYLDSAGHWFPRFGDEKLRFKLTVEVPASWRAVSQGQLDEATDFESKNIHTWTETQPQDDIYLIAGPFHRYQKPTPWGDALVFLRQSDPALAKRYLDATGQYLDLYSRLLGPYPYAKFALVENFWETGYGMPSFTLLGPRVIRLPFILHSSYPHEILHNWWGNGVYVDYASGNWSEGLTTYLADYLIAEQRGRGAQYRRSSLQKYADYVAAARDFPIREFRGRHGEVTQAVGYNKTLMFFHMLRLQLGDDRFLEGLRRFYRDNRFRTAGFSELRSAFEAISDEDLGPLFRQWLERSGAPRLKIDAARVEPDGARYRLRAVLKQAQKGPPYRLRVPIAVIMAGTTEPFQKTLLMEEKRLDIDLAVATLPLRLEVDPEFDLFRRLERSEIPASLGQSFGAERIVYVLPSGASRDLREGYRTLAEAWARDHGDAQVSWDRELEELPDDRAIWLLGWENRFRDQLAAALKGRLDGFTHQAVRLDGKDLGRDAYSLVLTARRSSNDDLGLAWLGADNAAALPGLARKLPHYGKYSYLAFTGDAPDNVLKGQWPVLDSPLKVDLAPGTPVHRTAALAPRPALSAAIDTEE